MLLDTQISMPSQDPMADNKFSLQPREIRKWLKNLPYVDQDAAVLQFYDGLKRSNRQAHTTRERLAAIDIIRPVAHDFLKNQRNYLLSQPFPLSKKANEILKLQQNILNELAVAYKIVIQETVNRDNQLSKKKLVTCVHHAMYYQVEQYITLAQVYSEPPQSFWKDLCQLYSIAEHFELSGLQIKNDISQANTKSSPKSIFIHACLLSLSNLHTYGHGEAEKISAYLSKATGQTKLVDRAPSESEYLFYINLALSKPVRLVIDEDIPMSSKNRYIDASELIKQLKEHSKDLENQHELAGTADHILNESLSKRLLKKITSKPIRASKRAVPAKGRLHVVMGMRDAIEILQSGHTVIEETKPQTRNYELMSTENTRVSRFYNDGHKDEENDYSVSSSSAWDWVGHGNTVTDHNVESIKKSEEKAILNPVVQTWDISNASKGGYCLTSTNTSDYQAQVGDLILIRLEENLRDDWRLGVIRWMQSLSEQGVKMGIETIHGTVEAIEIIDVHSVDDNMKNFDHVLSLIDKNASGESKTIITPPNAAAAGDHLVVSQNNRQQNIVLQHILEQTISFSKFSYSELPSMPGGEHF